MRNRIFLYLLLIAFVQPSMTAAFPLVWQKVNLPSSAAQPVLVPDRYEVFHLNTQLFSSVMATLPEDPAQAQLVDIPSPDGQLLKFRVWQTPIMEEGLAVKFPSIRTFTGYLESDPSATVKLDITEFGFHAMVFKGGETWLVDPFSGVEDGFYICYYKRDYTAPSTTEIRCEHVGKVEELKPEAVFLTRTGLPPMVLKTSGQVRRTFRLALACTGEYAVAVAGSNPTKSAVLSKMITSLNRVNGIYEREVAVTMVLVANNDDIVYLNGSTDPYTNNNGSTMMNQNKINLDNVIGAANYDIGHVFSTGGGGVAMLGSVCKTDKAKGVTGQPNPQGDAFDVDFVAHEMGHQFGADHSFNSGLSQCGSNAVQDEAYEPGSGTTIMAYAGLCASDNVQTQGNDYFHAISLMKITEFLESSSGATCAATSPSANTPPVVPAFSQTHAIPKLTPFRLTAPVAIDTDHDNLTYCWEQWNLGDFKKSFYQVRTEGPMFRTFPPDTSPVRVFPTMEKVLAGTTAYLGEKLPDTSRYLTFKLTVRDVLNGEGTYNFPDDTVHLDVIHTAGPFKVLSPATSSVTWDGGTNQTVTWDVAGTNLGPINCQSVEILLSEDGGLSFPHVLVANTPNDGSQVVVIPNVVTTNQARVMVRSVGNVFFNVNPVNFTIIHDPNNVQEVPWENLIEIFPVPARDQLSVRITNNMKLEVTLVNSVGQPVWKGSGLREFSIPVEGFPRGFYYVQLFEPNGGARIVRPVVLQ